MQLGEYIGEGDECRVYAWGKRKVLKVYTNPPTKARRDRDYAYWMQRRLHKQGLAPRAYIRLKWDDWRYAYISARADRVYTHTFEECAAWEAAAKILKARLEKLGLWSKDVHERNTSWQGKKLILIDCGPLTTDGRL